MATERDSNHPDTEPERSNDSDLTMAAAKATIQIVNDALRYNIEFKKPQLQKLYQAVLRRNIELRNENGTPKSPVRRNPISLLISQSIDRRQS